MLRCPMRTRTPAPLDGRAPRLALRGDVVAETGEPAGKVAGIHDTGGTTTLTNIHINEPQREPQREPQGHTIGFESPDRHARTTRRRIRDCDSI